MSAGGLHFVLALYKPSIYPLSYQVFDKRMSIQTGNTPDQSETYDVAILGSCGDSEGSAIQHSAQSVSIRLRVSTGGNSVAGENQPKVSGPFSTWRNGAGFKQSAFFFLWRVSSPNAFAASNREFPPWKLDMPSRRGKSIHRIHTVRPVFLIPPACCESLKDS